MWEIQVPKQRAALHFDGTSIKRWHYCKRDCMCASRYIVGLLGGFAGRMNDEAEVALVATADVAGGGTLAADWAFLITLTTLISHILELCTATYSFLAPPACTAALALPRYTNHILLRGRQSYGSPCEVDGLARRIVSTSQEIRCSPSCDILRLSQLRILDHQCTLISWSVPR